MEDENSCTAGAAGKRDPKLNKQPFQSTTHYQN